jgi:hypothetical protein
MIGSVQPMTKTSAIRAAAGMRVTTVIITTAMRGERG